MMTGLRGLLKQEQVNSIDQHIDNARRRHPAWTAIFTEDSLRDYRREPKDYLANRSAERADATDQPWLPGVLKRIAQTADFEEAASAMAELRAYGSLCEAGFEVEGISRLKTPTPDFKASIGDASAIVEVQTKVEHTDQTSVARKIAAGETPAGVERGVIAGRNARMESTVRIAHPFGAPDPEKEGDTTQTNAISRICSMKQKETQLAEGLPGILWLDFRNLSDWPDVLDPDQAQPLISWNGQLTSGAIWYAFYGWKDAPVFEAETRYRSTTTSMGHFGRFHPDNPKQSCYSAAVIVLTKATMLVENPMAGKPLPSAMRRAMLQLPGFEIQRSVAEWSPGHVRRSIELAREAITSFTQC